MNFVTPHTLVELLHPVKTPRVQDKDGVKGGDIIATKKIFKAFHLAENPGFALLLDEDGDVVSLLSYDDASKLVDQQEELSKLPTIYELRDQRQKAIDDGVGAYIGTKNPEGNK